MVENSTATWKPFLSFLKNAIRNYAFLNGKTLREKLTNGKEGISVPNISKSIQFQKSVIIL